ncbi:hypothetical protein [Parasitella parasitica]|uniref:Uncharacterized protein n=1 Tax=Parasitella parasitica TaxID=35722 RepID=A0A0B7N7D5_9FUNG|nr:hypothetical protein [Parasitella parasitica]
MSDFNNNNSAINANTAKNRKKKAKKKAKKQNTTDSSNTPSEFSTPNLTDKENIDSSALNGQVSQTAVTPTTATSNDKTAIITETQTTPADTSTLSGEASVLASSLPAKPIEGNGIAGNGGTAIITDAQTTAADTSTLTGEGSTLATSLPAKPIDESGATTVVAGAVNTAGAAATGVAAAGVAATGVAVSSSLLAPLPLSDNVKYAIESATASRSIDLYGIVDKIKSNVATGDYKEKAKLPSANTETTINSKAAAGTPKNAPAAVTTNNNTDSIKNPVKKAVASVGAAVAGGATALAAGKKSDGANHTTTNKAAVSSPQQNLSGSTTSEVAKLSESVQSCIKSAVQAPSVDVYGIIDPSQKVKRPEAAVGSSSQPTMPSSAKAPDVPKKNVKSPEHQNKPTFLKKKNCIIL